jgi:hypothetical protein
MDSDKGTYQCLVCGLLWDKANLLGNSTHKTCGDACCGGNVKKISDKSKNEHVAETQK